MAINVVAKIDQKTDPKDLRISYEKKVEILLKKHENSAVVVDIMEAVELGKKIALQQQ